MLKHSFHLSGTTGGILLLAFLVDLVVWYKAGSINFVDEQTGEDGSAEEMTTLKSQDAVAADNNYRRVSLWFSLPTITVREADSPPPLYLWKVDILILKPTTNLKRRRARRKYRIIFSWKLWEAIVRILKWKKKKNADNVRIKSTGSSDSGVIWKEANQYIHLGEVWNTTPTIRAALLQWISSV